MSEFRMTREVEKSTRGFVRSVRYCLSQRPAKPRLDGNRHRLPISICRDLCANRELPSLIATPALLPLDGDALMCRATRPGNRPICPCVGRVDSKHADLFKIGGADHGPLTQERPRFKSATKATTWAQRFSSNSAIWQFSTGIRSWAARAAYASARVTVPLCHTGSKAAWARLRNRRKAALARVPSGVSAAMPFCGLPACVPTCASQIEQRQNSFAARSGRFGYSNSPDTSTASSPQYGQKGAVATGGVGLRNGFWVVDDFNSVSLRGWPGKPHESPRSTGGYCSWRCLQVAKAVDCRVWASQ